jgi:hypothetical protein
MLLQVKPEVGVCAGTVTVTVTAVEPDPEGGLTATVPPGTSDQFSWVVVQVTPGAEAVTLMVPVRVPPEQPPTVPRESVEVTESVPPAEAGSKSAVADWFWFMVTLQEPVPEQAPDQPAKVEPVAGTALSITFTPEGNEVPVGNELIAPLPPPVVPRVSV